MDLIGDAGARFFTKLKKELKMNKKMNNKPTKFEKILAHNPNCKIYGNENCQYIEFIESVAEGEMFFGKAYSDGDVSGNNVYGVFTL